MQYTAWYDSVGRVILAKRDLETNDWSFRRTELTGNTADAHNAISIMVDGEGYLHIAWNHHNSRLQYRRSVAPGSLILTGNVPMTGTNEDDVTYPEFFRMPSGDLIFMYRSGASGRGNLVMNRYITKTQTWERIHTVLIDGEGERNAYWQACVDVQGTIHLSWVWRETPDVASNHDLCYARSRDGGSNWERSDGRAYALPITAENAEYAFRIPQGSELINQTSMYADDRGRPYIATYWADDDGIPQYQLVYHDGKAWHRQQISQRKQAFTLSGPGTKRIPMSRPQVVVERNGRKVNVMLVYRDAERGSRVSVAMTDNLRGGRWGHFDITDFSVGAWEPTYDTELWKSQHRLQLFVQRSGQGDGEEMEELEAQEVSVVEVGRR
ncbi:MAG TPA: BNR repeat-containing protein [Cyclobacteriaceae bacterium]